MSEGGELQMSHEINQTVDSSDALQINNDSSW